jgi:hypothetical protein
MLTCVEPALDLARSAASTDPDAGLRTVTSPKQTVYRKHGKRIGSR